jgi:hypothetical protein
MGGILEVNILMGGILKVGHFMGGILKVGDKWQHQNSMYVFSGGTSPP